MSFFDTMQITSDKIDGVQNKRSINRRILKEFPLKRREQIAIVRREEFIDGRKILRIDGFAKRRQHQIALDDLCDKEKALDDAYVALQEANVYSHQVSVMIDVADDKLTEIENEKTRIERMENELLKPGRIEGNLLVIGQEQCPEFDIYEIRNSQRYKEIQKITRSESNFGHVFAAFALAEKTRSDECKKFIEATNAGLSALETVQLAEEAVILANIRLLKRN
jgi:hypothetical protein